MIFLMTAATRSSTWSAMPLHCGGHVGARRPAARTRRTAPWRASQRDARGV